MKTFYFLFVFVFLFSCENTEVSKVNQRDVDAYRQFEQVVTLDMNAIGQALNGAKIYDNGVLENAANTVYGDRQRDLEAFKSAFHSSNNRRASSDDLSLISKAVLDEINSNMQSSKEAKDFINYLSTKFEEIAYADDINDVDADFLLKYIIAYKAAVIFMEANTFSIKGDGLGNERISECDGWWACWGKCAAGTVGGAITGALGGAAVASVVPILGTAAGAVAGAVGGGLTGAAAAC